MKIFLSFFTLLICLAAIAQPGKKKLSNDDLRKSAGSWTGNYNEYQDGKVLRSAEASLEMKWVGDSLQLSLHVKWTDSESAEETGLHLSADGSKLFFEGKEYDVLKVLRNSGQLVITVQDAAENSNINGVEADVRKTFNIAPDNFIISTDVQFSGNDKFVKRNQYWFSRKK